MIKLYRTIQEVVTIKVTIMVTLGKGEGTIIRRRLRVGSILTVGFVHCLVLVFDFVIIH